MPRTNPSKVDRLPLELRLELCRRLLDNAPYDAIRAHLSERGVGPDDLPQDRAFRAYQNSDEFRDLRERLVDTLLAGHEELSFDVAALAALTSRGGVEQVETATRALAILVLQRRLERADRLFTAHNRAADLADVFALEAFAEGVATKAATPDAAGTVTVGAATAAQKVTDSVGMVTDSTDCEAVNDLDNAENETDATDAKARGDVATAESESESESGMTPVQARAAFWTARRDRLAKDPGMLKTVAFVRATTLLLKLLREQRLALDDRPHPSPSHVTDSVGKVTDSPRPPAAPAAAQAPVAPVAPVRPFASVGPQAAPLNRAARRAQERLAQKNR